MSFYQTDPRKFRETLKHEDHIHNQIDSCRIAFNSGDASRIRFAVEALLLLITPSMIDPKFIADLKSLDEKWQKDKIVLDGQYRVNVKRARSGCPDLVQKPHSNPGIANFKQKFMIACALFERKNLMLKIETQDQV